MVRPVKRARSATQKERSKSGIFDFDTDSDAARSPTIAPARGRAANPAAPPAKRRRTEKKAAKPVASAARASAAPRARDPRKRSSAAPSRALARRSKLVKSAPRAKGLVLPAVPAELNDAVMVAKLRLGSAVR